MTRIKSLLISCIIASLAISTGFATPPQTSIANMAAGTVVTRRDVDSYGADRCFTAVSIPDDVFRRMEGKSYKRGCTVARSCLRYVRVLHYNEKKEIMIGELVCHKSIAADLIDIFRKLYRAKYPIERMVLIDNYGADDERSMDANNTSCFNFRQVAGSKVLSCHSMGKAIDINPRYNPHVKRDRKGNIKVSPLSGKRYADRSRDFLFKIDATDLCYKEFIRHGFKWGGSWRSSKDYQHFEKK